MKEADKLANFLHENYPDAMDGRHACDVAIDLLKSLLTGDDRPFVKAFVSKDGWCENGPAGWTKKFDTMDEAIWFFDKLSVKKPAISFDFDEDPDGEWFLDIDCTREQLAFAIAVLEHRFGKWMDEGEDEK